MGGVRRLGLWRAGPGHRRPRRRDVVGGACLARRHGRLASAGARAATVRPRSTGWPRSPTRRRVRREALELLADVGLPTPQLVVVDPDGSRAGAPSVLMARLPGGVDVGPAGRRGVPARAGRAAAGDPLGAGCAGGVLPDYRPYPLRMRRPPAWAARPDVWRRAFDVIDAASPGSSERSFVHRDYHPGNVLWEGGRVSRHRRLGQREHRVAVGGRRPLPGEHRLRARPGGGRPFSRPVPRGVRPHGRLPPLLGHLGRDRRPR